MDWDSFIDMFARSNGNNDKNEFDDLLAVILSRCLNSRISQYNDISQPSSPNENSGNSLISRILNEYRPSPAAQTITTPTQNKFNERSAKNALSDAVEHSSPLQEEVPESDSAPDAAPYIDTDFESPPQTESFDFSKGQDLKPEEKEQNTSFQSAVNIPIAAPLRKEVAIGPDVIETHDFVIIKVKIPYGITERDFSISIDSNIATIKWKNGYFEQVINLPSDIIKERSSAYIKNGCLEVKIPRTTDDNSKIVFIGSM